MLDWLLGAAGSATAALPVNWAADALAAASQRWFRRLRRSDDLSRLVKAATGTSVDLSAAEFDAVRELLEDQQTWRLVGHGTVDDLAVRIAVALPLRDGRTVGEVQAAALTIARGLLEFAVADLDPKLFQQVLIARLNRIEADRASALDTVLVDLHGDLTAGFADVMSQLKRVLGALPPGPAQRGEIAIYLRALIDGLNRDPWPRHRRFDGPVLTPADIERKLRVTADRASNRDLDADELAQRCERLVILGGPGSGKTWLAKRTARRCAEAALLALSAGESVNEIELPLYTSCQRLFDADGAIRQAAVSSALGQLGDLGGSRISAALNVFFAERNGPTVLVIDSLDEARGSCERLYQADTLPWRIILTSRPSSWDRQLDLKEKDDAHKAGEIQPLRYPEDVVPFIHRWFDGQPERGEDLVAQIARRRGLQEATGVPLILAFYCILAGAGGPLPEFRHDLYARVLNRMLTGRWRASGDSSPDLGTSLQTLRTWAWSAAATHPVSGVGAWADEIPAGPDQAEAEALDHVAPPIGPPDIDSGTTLRRFVHRSIREHLVAEHVASLPVGQAAEILLPHLWYDPDWEYTAPAAVANHQHREELLRDLIRRAARSAEIPPDLSVVDSGLEFRKFLARIAAESSESGWSPEAASIIGNARHQLSRQGYFEVLGGATSWETSNRQARQELLKCLRSERFAIIADKLARDFVHLGPAEEDRRQAREALLGLLPSQTENAVAAALIDGVIELGPTAQDKRQALAALLPLLAIQDDSFLHPRLPAQVIELAVTTEDMRQARAVLLGLLASDSSHQQARRLLEGVISLTQTAEDERQAREVLLGLLDTPPGERHILSFSVLANGVVRLAPAAKDKREDREALYALLASETTHPAGASTLDEFVRLAPAEADKRETREALLALLALLGARTDTRLAVTLADTVNQLDPTPADQHQSRERLIALLTDPADRSAASQLADCVLRLDPTAGDKRRVREAVLAILTGLARNPLVPRLLDGVVEMDSLTGAEASARGPRLRHFPPDYATGWAAIHLANSVTRLDPTVEDQRQAREVLLAQLNGQRDDGVAIQLANIMINLDPTAEDTYAARKALLVLLEGQTSSVSARELADMLVDLASTAEERRDTREALIELVARPVAFLASTDSPPAPLLTLLDNRDGCELAVGVTDAVAQLDPTPEDKQRLRDALLLMLLGPVLEQRVSQVVSMPQDRQRAHEQIRLWSQAKESDGPASDELVDRIIGIVTTEEPKNRPSAMAISLSAQLARFEPSAEEQRVARQILIGLLTTQTDESAAESLADAMIQLHPGIRDLDSWPSWAAIPPAILLSEVRRNSSPADWLAALPSLPG